MSRRTGGQHTTIGALRLPLVIVLMVLPGLLAGTGAATAAPTS